MLNYFAEINKNFTLLCVFPAMLLLGLYLTVRLRFIQIFKLKESFRNLMSKKLGDEGDISHFEAIAAVLAGNFGTGNISGMAIALATGGPGSLVWMWIMAFLGSAIQYASCFLGVRYRSLNQRNEYAGGPMYYLAEGLRAPTLAKIFAFFTICGAISVGSLVQINSMTLPIQKMGGNPFYFGLMIAFLIAIVIFGGLKRMAKIASLIVPFKAFLYLGTALVIIALNYHSLIPAIKLMFASAFDFQAAWGGLLGAGALQAISTGFDRGIFATDAGTGIVPMLQSSARTKNPVIDGLVTLVAPFMVMFVCTTTGIILIMTGAWEIEGLQSTNMVTYAFEKGLGSSVGSYIVIIALILFGYTTILAWACCAEKAMEFLCGTHSIKCMRFAYVALIPLGAVLRAEWAWTLADLCITSMLMVNMIGIAGLSSEVIASSNRFFDSKSIPSNI